MGECRHSTLDPSQGRKRLQVWESNQVGTDPEFGSLLRLHDTGTRARYLQLNWSKKGFELAFDPTPEAPDCEFSGVRLAHLLRGVAIFDNRNCAWLYDFLQLGLSFTMWLTGRCVSGSTWKGLRSTGGCKVLEPTFALPSSSSHSMQYVAKSLWEKLPVL